MCAMIVATTYMHWMIFVLFVLIFVYFQLSIGIISLRIRTRTRVEQIKNVKCLKVVVCMKWN